MIEELLSKLDEELSNIIDLKSLSSKQLSSLHAKIKGEKNHLLNRTVFYLLTAQLYHEDNSKVIEVDIKSSLDDPYHELISGLIEKRATKPKTIKTNAKLSKKENILLGALEEEKYNRQQLIVMIYGEEYDYLKAETSFKSLLYRFKKKLNGEINTSLDGIYSISY